MAIAVRPCASAVPSAVGTSSAAAAAPCGAPLPTVGVRGSFSLAPAPAPLISFGEALLPEDLLAGLGSESVALLLVRIFG